MRINALVGFFFLAAAAFGQTGSTQSAPVWSGSYTADFKSKYFGSTVCAVFADQPVIQEDLDVIRALTSKTALTISIWNSTGFTQWFQNFAYETDLDFNVGHRFGKYDVSAGGWFFFLNPNAKTDVLVGDVRLSRKFSSGFASVTPFIELQSYTLTNKDVGYHGGSYLMAGASYSRKLVGRFSLAMQFRENYDANGGFGKRKGSSVYYGDAGLHFAVTESLSVTVPRFGLGGSWDDPARPTRTIWSGGISKSF